MTVKSKAAATGQKTKDHDAEDDTAVEARIYQSIFDGVLDHRLTPGTKLPEPQLCQLFGVGRAVVRRVLEKLAYDGIVVLRPNKGAVIAAPTPEETREIFEARRALERTLVELAVEKASARDIEALRQQLAEEHKAMHRFDQPAWARLTELISRTSLIVGVYEAPGNAPCEHDEHAAIVDCIEARDAAGAVARMTSHLRELEERIETSRMPGEKSLAQLLGMTEA
jgi:DNA-binding GntR family transcriptional regulator